MDKMKILLATAAMTAVVTAAEAAPDPLLSAKPKTGAPAETLIITPAAEKATEEAVRDFAEAWRYAKSHIAEAKSDKKEGKILSDEQKAWLKAEEAKYTYADRFLGALRSKVNFYERSMNWNGHNQQERTYRYETLPAYDEERGYTDSYGYSELRDMADRMAEAVKETEAKGYPETEEQAQSVASMIVGVLKEAQEDVRIDELRTYMNETVWYAAKQAIKEKSEDEPNTENTKRIENLRKLAKEMADTVGQ